MEKLYHYVETAVVHYRVNSCCWFAPVRIGIYIIGYLNLLTDVVSLVGTANESFSPTILKVEEIILEDNASKPIPILAYSTELGFTVLLLCGLYRNDIILLRVYMYYVAVAVIASILVYSMVIAAIDVLLIIAIVFSILFQMYMLVLVWSAIVEIRDGPEKNGDIKVVYDANDQEIKEMTVKSPADVEAPTEPEAGPAPTETEKVRDVKERETKLETVTEDPKET